MELCLHFTHSCTSHRPSLVPRLIPSFMHGAWVRGSHRPCCCPPEVNASYIKPRPTKLYRHVNLIITVQSLLIPVSGNLGIIRARNGMPKIRPIFLFTHQLSAISHNMSQMMWPTHVIQLWIWLSIEIHPLRSTNLFESMGHGIELCAGCLCSLTSHANEGS